MAESRQTDGGLGRIEGDMAKKYQDELNAKTKAAQMLASVPVVGKGATTFADIDRYLTENADAKYFRIANGGNIDSARSYQTPYGQWSDNSAALVSDNKADVGSRDIFRYINVSPASVRTGKRGETPTYGLQYVPSDFYKETGGQYSTEDGYVLSREEFGKLKEQLKAKGAGGFDAAKTRPQDPVTDKSGDKTTATPTGDTGGRGVPSILGTGDALGGDKTEQPSTTYESTDEDALNKRTLLG